MKKHNRSKDIKEIDPKLKKEVDKILNQIPNKTDPINMLVRFVALVFFCCLVIFDKLLHQFVPPIPDLWYGIAVGVALFGKNIATVWTTFKKGE